MSRLSTRLGALAASMASSAAVLSVAVVPLAALVPAHDAKAPSIADASPVKKMPGGNGDNGTYEIEIQGMTKALVISCQPEASRPQWTVPVKAQNIGGEAGKVGDANVPNPQLTDPAFKHFGTELVAYKGSKQLGRSGCLNPDQNSDAYTWSDLLTPSASAWGDTPGSYGQANAADKKKRSATADRQHGMAILPGQDSAKAPQEAAPAPAAPPASPAPVSPAPAPESSDVSVTCSQKVRADDDIAESDKDEVINDCIADGGEVSQPAWAGPGFGTWLLAGLAALLTLFAGRHSKDRAEIDPSAMGWRGKKAVAASTSRNLILVALSALLGWWAVSNAVDSAGWCFRMIFAVALGALVGRAGARMIAARVGEHAKLADAKHALANAPKLPLLGVLTGVLTWASEGFGDLALLIYGSTAGLVIGAGYALVQAMTEYHAARASVAHGLAAWLGYASPDALMQDVDFYPTGDFIAVNPPPKVRADLPAYVESLPRSMPEWSVESAEPGEVLMLRKATSEEIAQRQDAAASAGAFAGTSDWNADPDSGFASSADPAGGRPLPPLPPDNPQGWDNAW